ncbi:[FeFe] hydrogenase H-cluster radical SAM maturase HydE [Planctomycetota bacterium]
MKQNEIINWLKEDNQKRLNDLWNYADVVRRQNVKDEVHLRGLVEISNYCIRHCLYCGLNAGNRKLLRYRMSADEILPCVFQAWRYGYGAVVLQAGEDYAIDADWMARTVRRIKRETPLAVTLSLGERNEKELAAWYRAGADRYLLRFETSDRKLYNSIHPFLPEKRSDRISILRTLKQLGYETGSGVMVGVPEQTYHILANDIEMFAKLDLDMVGIGPYIPHPDTSLGRRKNMISAATIDQVPNTELMTYKVIALTRIICPETNIPSTTALVALNRRHAFQLGLSRGANVIMLNLTPWEYRALYEIYPAKACLYERAEQYDVIVKEQIRSLGRKIGAGRGDSVHFTRTRAATNKEREPKHECYACTNAQ